MTKLTSFILPEGAKAFHAKPAKDTVTPRRERVTKRIDEILAMIEKGETKPRGAPYEIRGDVARATIRLGSRPLVIENQEEFFVAKDKLTDFYKEVKKQIGAGEHDEALANMDRGTDGKPESAAKPKKSGNYGWSPERKARFQATLAAKKAASGK